jgi:anti-anti-sigma factor
MIQKASARAAGLFEMERVGGAMVVTPLVDLREFDYERIEAAACDILGALDDPGTKNVVLDFNKTDYYGSTALGFFTRIWKKVRMQGGRMAFCNVSKHELEILAVTHLDRLWPIFATRKEALEFVGETAGGA